MIQEDKSRVNNQYSSPHKIIEWKWTQGEPYERSRRPLHTDSKNNHGNNGRLQEFSDSSLPEHFFSKEIEQSAYSTSLNHDENTWDILNQQSIHAQGFRQTNKREELHDKIASRDLVQQIGFNPFLNNTTNYVNDISIRDQFMKPVNTSEEKERKEIET